MFILDIRFHVQFKSIAMLLVIIFWFFFFEHLGPGYRSMFGTSESLGQDVLKNKLFNNNKANVLGKKKQPKKEHTHKKPTK